MTSYDAAVGRRAAAAAAATTATGALLLGGLLLGAAACQSLEAEMFASDDPFDDPTRLLLGIPWGLLAPLLLVLRVLGVRGVVVYPSETSAAFYVGYVIGLLLYLTLTVRLVARLLQRRRKVTCAACGWRGRRHRFKRTGGCPRCGASAVAGGRLDARPRKRI
jgi:hypothetical protein